MHAVLAIDNDRIFVITVYKPSTERWEDGRGKRKQEYQEVSAFNRPFGAVQIRESTIDNGF